MNILQKTRPSFSLIQVLVIAVAMTGGVARGAGQVRTGETVTQKLTEQYESLISLYPYSLVSIDLPQEQLTQAQFHLTRALEIISKSIV